MVKSGDYNLVDAARANTSFGQVDDSPQGLLVVFINCESQIPQQVLNFLSLIEGQSTDHFLLYVYPSQGLFHGAGLAVGSVKDRKFFIGHLIMGFLLKDGCCDKFTFLMI